VLVECRLFFTKEAKTQWDDGVGEKPPLELALPLPPSLPPSSFFFEGSIVVLLGVI